MINYKNNYFLDAYEIFPSWCDVGKYEENNIKRSSKDGKITWNIEPGIEHYDHVEMSGSKASVITSYGVDRNRKLKLHHHFIYPNRRINPNDTHGSLAVNYDMSHDLKYACNIDNQELYVTNITFDGTLVILMESDHYQIVRQIFTSTSKEAIIEKFIVTNISEYKLCFSKKECSKIEYFPSNTVEQSVKFGVYLEASDEKFDLETDETYTYYQIHKINDVSIEPEQELQLKSEFFKKIDNKCVLETPDMAINELFKYSKRRLCESIFDTKNGLMHAPGGGRYYAALWTNDQCEYANPLFPYIGYEPGINQSINCYKLFAEYMDNDFAPLVSSIVAAGDSFWNGAGDRGDAAMFGSGVTRFLLEMGNQELIVKFLPAIEWSVMYCEKHINEEGVLASDCDELENRFESGDANLASSCLLYDLYINLSNIYTGLKKEETLIKANVLKANINNYFSANVEGFDTYKYYKENNSLRAWICLPLVFGIADYVDQTVSALYSDKLWTKNGLRTDSNNDETFWDRSTLFALRALFFMSDADKAYKKLLEFSTKRLTGNHIPYVVEAYPEGNQKHLSAESALYLKIILHGMLGLNSIGNKTWTLKINLPSSWNYLKLKNVYMNNEPFTLDIIKDKDMYCLSVYKDDELIKKINCKHNYATKLVLRKGENEE